MTLKVKVNGEWVKLPVLAALDAINTRFNSSKYTATNVSAALDEVADNLPSAASRLAEAYAYAKMLNDISQPRYVFFATDFSTDYQETYDFPVVYQSPNNHTEEVYSDGWDYEMEEYSFESGKLYLFRPAGEEGMHLPFEVHSVDDIEACVHFLN